MSFVRLVVVSSLVGLVGCGGASTEIPDGPGSSGTSSGNGGSSGSSGTSSGSSGSSGVVSGPALSISLRGSTSPFQHTDSFSGQTPAKQIIAIRSLWLLRSLSDPSPVKVFDHGEKAVETDLVSGNATELAKVAIASLPAGKFTLAKVGAAYVRYSVKSRLHTPAAYDGLYDNVQALTEGAVIDGVTRKKGWFRYSFLIGGASVGTTEGDNAPTPLATTTGGITMDLSGPETFYSFAIDLAIDPQATTGVDVLFEENVDRSFRWQDENKAGYSAGVYDTTTTTFEPVMAFGGNSFVVTANPK